MLCHHWEGSGHEKVWSLTAAAVENRNIMHMITLPAKIASKVQFFFSWTVSGNVLLEGLLLC